MLRRGFLMLIVLVVCATRAYAQSDDDAVWQDIVEQWAEQNESESIPDDYLELLQGFVENPINVNDTNSDALEELLFISDFQRASLRAYIAQNGQMVSLAELYLVNGFDSVTVRQLQRFVTVSPVENKRLSLGQMLKNGRNGLMVGTKRSFPISRGYAEDIYAGSPFRIYFRYNYKYSDRINFQLSGEKDAGEAFAFERANGRNQYGFDNYGYHLMLKDFGVVKRAVVGKYQLQFGQGVTLWSGFAPWISSNMSLRRYGAGIKTASAFSEYGYLRGVATTVSLLPTSRRQTLEMTLFYSNVDRDATLSATSGNNDEERIYQSLYQSGLHRTENEKEKKNQLNEQLFGGHLQYRNKNLVVGGTIYSTLLANAILPADNAYNVFAFRGKKNLNYGFDVTYNIGKVQLFGEVAMSNNDTINQLRIESGGVPLATIAGMNLQIGGNNSFSLAYRYGSPTYQNLYANMIGRSSSAGNESGVMMIFNTRLPYYINMQIFANHFHYPYLRYRIYSPSSGVDYRIKLFKEITSKTMLSGQYRYILSQRNSDGQMYYVETIRRQQMQLTLDYNMSSKWRFVSRLAFSWFDCEDHSSERGFLVFQEVDYKAKIGGNLLVLGLRLSLFDISDYDARIYSYESDMLYEYNVPMFNGRGLRNYFIFRYELNSQLSIALKYAMAFYPDQESMGSGYEKTEGGKKQEIKAQLRWRF